MPSAPLFVAAAFALATPSPQVPLPEIETLALPGAVANERAGEVLVLDAAHAVVGSPSRSVGGQSQQGAAVVWPRAGSVFGAPSIVLAPTPAAGGQFGAGVALEGDELVVTERSSLHFGTPARGAFHRYRVTGGAWSWVDSTPNPGFGSSNGFGAGVDRSGDVLVVGAPFDSSAGPGRGAVYVYRLVGGAWQAEATLTASDGQSGDRFGMQVAVSGSRIVIGAAMRQTGSVQTGAAYVFERQGAAWAEVQRLAPDPATSDRLFGVDVDVDGDTAVIGATRTNDRGSAYVFVAQGPGWIQQQRLQPANLGTFATFGYSVALLGDSLVVGAYQDTVLGNLTGSAWLFERVGTQWSPLVRLAPSQPLGAFYGQGVALDGAGTVLVGEPNRTPSGGPAIAGVIRHHTIQRPFGAAYCAPVANSTGRRGGIGALGSDIALDDQVTLVAYDLPVQAFGYFLASRTQGLVLQPGGGQGVLCLGGGIGRYVGPGQIKNTGASGVFALPLDLGQTPQPSGAVGVAAGETWNFQAWHRDFVAGVSTSNFSDAIAVSFR